MTHPQARVQPRAAVKPRLGTNVYVEDRAVDVHIRRLHQALEPRRALTAWCRPMRGTGYRFQPAFNALLAHRTQTGLMILNWSILRAGTAVVEKAGAGAATLLLPALSWVHFGSAGFAGIGNRTAYLAFLPNLLRLSWWLGGS